MKPKGTAHRILLLSDTHSHLDQDILRHVKAADEVWHAGDVGQFDVIDKLLSIKPLRVVHGNIDDALMRREAPLDLHFTLGGVTFWMTHIGGPAGRLPKAIRAGLLVHKPDVFICGHSHILRA
ncbi:MAG TPA: YfcE family phosphodiesterase, partial [Cryomorphaceae bacterium]|nr:YfcE family phosphodiesterase [Cryomorphaceae bacterium]